MNQITVLIMLAAAAGLPGLFLFRCLDKGNASRLRADKAMAIASHGAHPNELVYETFYHCSPIKPTQFRQMPYANGTPHGKRRANR